MTLIVLDRFDVDDINSNFEQMAAFLEAVNDIQGS